MYTYSSFSAKVTSTFIVRLLTLYFKGKDTSLGTICILYLQLQKRTKRCQIRVDVIMKLIPHIHNFLCWLLFVHIYCLSKYNINNKNNRTYSIFYWFLVNFLKYSKGLKLGYKKPFIYYGIQFLLFITPFSLQALNYFISMF